jgi:hypothetical protein
MLYFPPSLSVERSSQTNQSKRYSLLSQLALSSQFFLKSPPKTRRRDRLQGPPDPDPAPGRAPPPEPDEEGCAGWGPSSPCESCPSVGLDHAFSDLISLDSQAEVDQGTPGTGALLGLRSPASSFRPPLSSGRVLSLTHHSSPLPALSFCWCCSRCSLGLTLFTCLGFLAVLCVSASDHNHLGSGLLCLSDRISFP